MPSHTKIHFKHLRFWAVTTFLLCLWFLFPSSLPSSLPTMPGEIAFFSNQADHDLQRTLYHYLNHAKRSIWIASYNLSDRTTIKILNRKAQEGVKIHLVYDKAATKDLTKKLSKKVNLHPCQFEGLMHIKLILIDQSVTLWGSANITIASLRYHPNMILVGNTPLLTKHLEKYLEFLAYNKEPTGKWKGTLPFNLTTPTGWQQKVELFPLPYTGDKALKTLFDAIASAKKSIHIDMFTWTRIDLAKAILAAHHRGVKVSVTIDRDSAHGASAIVVNLLRKGGVKVRENRGDGIYHYKMITVDEKIWIGGSANWTKAAFEKNREIITLISPLTAKQLATLQKLWLRSEAQYRIAA